MVEITEYAPGTPSWIDLSSPDIEASKAFYSRLFGWQADPVPVPDSGGYTFFRLKGKMVGGVAPTMSPTQPPAWGMYVSVDNADATVEAVRAHGGQVIVEPMAVFNSGRMAVFADPTGAVFSVWQPIEHKGSQLANEQGAFCWNELATRDMTTDKAFYTQVFPWSAETNDMGGMAYTEWKLDGRSIAGGMEMGAQFPTSVPPHWLTYFGVADCDATIAQAQALGGKVMNGPMDSPNGRFAVLSDPHGAVFGVVQVQ